MHTGLLILRWVGAVVLAFHVYLVALGFSVFVARKFGMAGDWSIASATMAAAIAGALVVPREQRGKAARAICILALLYPVWVNLHAVSAGRLDAKGLSALLYTLTGGCFAWLFVKSAFARRHDGQDASGHHITS